MPTKAPIDDRPRMQTAYQALRQRVLSMHPGVPMPPVPELIRELSVSQGTIDRAYDLLEQQGLIERKRRKGVFAADRLATGEIAIVLSEINLRLNASPNYALTCSLLRNKLHLFNPKWAVKLHLGVSTINGRDMHTTLDLLEPTVLSRLRGVLSFHSLFEMEKELVAAGVPVVYLGSRSEHTPGVYVDIEQILLEGIRHLAESGCNDIVLLHSRYVGNKGPVLDRIPALTAAAAKCGLTFRDEWIGHEEGGWSEHHGYELFMQMWDKTKRPDGVVVFDEVLCHGVLRAIMERQVNLPRDLRLVTPASHNVTIPYPRPVTRVEYDLDTLTDKAVRMLETLARGQPLEIAVERVPTILVKGETT